MVCLKVLLIVNKGPTMVKILIVFYSMYGHCHKLAEAEAEGVREVEGVEAVLYQVPETIPDEILEKTGSAEAKKAFAHIPVATPETLADADGLILGTPTRYGNMTGQMRNFLDQTGSIWIKHALEGKVGSVFTSSSTQHGGQETTIISTHFTMLHHGMLIAGVPYSEPRISTMDEISGGSPYGASCVAGHGLKDRPTENELAIARTQGRRVAEITRDLVRGREAK
jgi:NAD(P)H dehydrogenase (quinone)